MWVDKAFLGSLQEADTKPRICMQEVHFGGQMCGHMEITRGERGLCVSQVCLG